MTILKTNTVSGIGTEGTVFEGDITFDSLNYMTLPKGTSSERITGARGIFAGGRTPAINVIQYWDFTAADPGVALDFGNLSAATRYAGGCGSNTRGIIYNGYQPNVVNRIEYITIATTGDASDFGDSTEARQGGACFSNQTRGIYACGGKSPADSNVIDYITIATTGNAADFGDATGTWRYMQGCASPTRGVYGAGNPNSSPNISKNLDYVEIATTGNVSDFGDLITDRRGVISFSSNIRGIFAGGYTPTLLNSIEFITIASTGNSKDFGDLSDTGQHNPGALSDGMRGHIGGGGIGPSPSLIGLQAVTIPTMGNSFAFGDLLIAGSGGDGPAGISDGHGGLT